MQLCSLFSIERVDEAQQQLSNSVNIAALGPQGKTFSLIVMGIKLLAGIIKHFINVDSIRRRW